MHYYLYFFIPALISTEIYKVLDKEINLLNSIKVYFIHLFFINVVSTAVTVKFWEGFSNIQDYLLNCPAVGIKYAILSGLISMIFPFIIIFIKKSFRLEMNIIEKEKQEQKDIKNNKNIS